MDIEQLQSAVFEAYKRRDYARCGTLLDDFISTASGEQLGKALSLKAGLMARVDLSQAHRGLDLLDEALGLLASDPTACLIAVVDALALCYELKNTERADTYAVTGYRMLRTHADHPGIIANRFRLHINLGQLATVHANWVKAYWHFQEATRDLLRAGASDDPALRCFLFWSHLHAANACTQLQRLGEATAEMELAEQYISDAETSDRWRAASQAITASLSKALIVSDDRPAPLHPTR